MIKKLSGKIVYENQWIRLHEDKVEFSDSKEGIYAYTERVDEGPMMIAMNEDNEFLILREWRYPIQNWVYQFPAGGVEPGESTLSAAKRELEEETGYRADSWVKLGTFYVDPGGSSQKTDVFLAQNLNVGTMEKGSSENHEAVWMPLEELKKLAVSSVVSSWLLSGIQLIEAYLRKQGK